MPYDHLQGKGCPKCRQSKLEMRVMRLLEGNNIEFEYQKRFEWLGKQSLDFYLPKYNLVIECQGKQHFMCGGWTKNFNFREQIDRDELKYKLCIENGVKILYLCDKKYFNSIVSEIYSNNSIVDIEDIIDILKEM